MVPPNQTSAEGLPFSSVDLGLHFAGGQALVVHLDAVQLFESAGRRLPGRLPRRSRRRPARPRPWLRRSGTARERWSPLPEPWYWRPREPERLGSRGRCIAAAGCQRSNHQNGHQNCKNLFHRLCFLHLLILPEKVCLFVSAASFRDADIIHRRFRLVNKAQKLTLFSPSSAVSESKESIRSFSLPGNSKILSLSAPLYLQ